jgi:hypothetical protein
MSLIDTWAATGAGAFTLSENGLYTTEAWQIFLQRLTPAGVFTVSRWYAPGEVNETGRMVSLAVATLHAMGVSDPKQHLFMASSGNVATLIVSRSALSAQGTGSLRQAAAMHGFTVLLEPQAGSASDLLESIVLARDKEGLQRATEASERAFIVQAINGFCKQRGIDRVREAPIYPLLPCEHDPQRGHFP